MTRSRRAASRHTCFLLCQLATAASGTSFSKDLAALHSTHETDGSPCTHLFLDVGSNEGGVTWDFFHQLNCYESCGGNSTCRPDNWSAQSCKFCNSANLGRQCGWMWPWWLPRDIRRGYCAIAFEPNSAVSSKLHSRMAGLRHALPGVSVRVVNDTAISVRDGEASFGIDTGVYAGRSSSLALSRTSPLKSANVSEAPVGASVEVGSQRQTRVRTLDFVHYLRALHSVTSIALWLDVEGTEFALLRDLLTSGALCAHVDNLWIGTPIGSHGARKGCQRASWRCSKCTSGCSQAWTTGQSTRQEPQIRTRTARL